MCIRARRFRSAAGIFIQTILCADAAYVPVDSVPIGIQA